MRRIPWHLPVLLPLLTLAAPVRAQEPEKSEKPTPKAESPAAERGPGRGNRGNRAGARRRGGARRNRQPVTAITAKFVHPVSGPVIENGVVLVRGERILAVGKQGEVRIPESATTRDFPNGHVYPGLIDAETDAFTDPATQRGGLDAGMALADDLQLRHNRDDSLAAAGITVAYVSAPAGQGAIVRPRREGFEVWEGKEKAGLQLRMTSGPRPTHALQRQQQLDGLKKTFDGLDKYEKAKKDYNKALDKYEKDFAEYLAWHEKNKGKKKAGDGKPADKTESAAPAGRPAGRGPRGRRPVPPGDGKNAEPLTAEEQQTELAFETLLEILAEQNAQDPKPAPPGPKGVAQKPSGKADGKDKKKDGPPKRPSYPKPFKEDPKKETLLAVLEGEMPLRVEAHRPDELRAALHMQRKNDVPLLVLEQAYGAGTVAKELAETGATVVLTEVLPNSMPELYDAFDPCTVPQALHAAGVPFAIATGKARSAPLLPLMAATAVGKGLDAKAALRAITLTPAEILGIQKDTGSLARGKFADLIVCDRPLFDSDSRVLFVLGKGRTEFEGN
ncbi:MAG: amidohydrolase family protein [bacterium]|nr:amidohydrolase family protein [bacterium]